MSLCLNFQLPSNPWDTWKTRSGSHRHLTHPADFSRAASFPRRHKQTKVNVRLIATVCNQLKDYSHEKTLRVLLTNGKKQQGGYFSFSIPDLKHTTTHHTGSNYSFHTVGELQLNGSNVLYIFLFIFLIF